MLRLLKIEIHKLKRYRTFWIMLSLHLAAILFITWSLDFFVTNAYDTVKAKANQRIYFPIYEFPDVWHNLTYMAVFLRFLLGVLVISLINNEFTYKTIRQQIIDGLDRQDFVVGKVLLIATISLISTVFVWLTGTIWGLIKTKPTDYEYYFTQFSFIPVYFLQVMVYLSFALFLGVLIKRSGLAISLLFVYAFAEQILIGRLLRTENDWVVNALPFNTPIDETNVPFTKYGLLSVDSSFTLIELLPAFGYIFFFIFAVYFILTKTDL